MTQAATWTKIIFIYEKLVVHYIIQIISFCAISSLPVGLILGLYRIVDFIIWPNKNNCNYYSAEYE